VPVTHAQYQIFVQASQHQPPEHWEDDRPPKGLESHPVVWVSWHDAAAYCEWLSNVTDKTITLPSESQWEKACRGSRDQRAYPWGDGFDASRCNSRELGLGQTTPVGIFPQGASPYGCLDMAGNVWEWCRTKWQDDYQDYQDDNTLGGEAPRVLRGGSFYYSAGGVRCAVRYGDFPYLWNLYVGFRVVLVGSPSFL
jgi:formylglycine-generating enzyme required for sulfatase activity